MAFAKINECLDNFIKNNSTLSEAWEDDVDTTLDSDNRHRDVPGIMSPSRESNPRFRVSPEESAKIRANNEKILKATGRDPRILPPKEYYTKAQRAKWNSLHEKQENWTEEEAEVFTNGDDTELYPGVECWEVMYFDRDKRYTKDFEGAVLEAESNYDVNMIQPVYPDDFPEDKQTAPHWTEEEGIIYADGTREYDDNYEEDTISTESLNNECMTEAHMNNDVCNSLFEEE